MKLISSLFVLLVTPTFCISCDNSAKSSSNNNDDINGFSSNAKYLSTGSEFACAINQDNKAKCIGKNYLGVLGNGNNDEQNTWVDVFGNITFSIINTSIDHSCGISDNATYCWGSNNSGQLGNNSYINSNTPVLVTNSDSLKFKKISAGSLTTCALSEAGKIYCWGASATSINMNIPTLLNGVNEEFISVATSKDGQASQNSFMESQTCGVTKSGSVYCWSLGTNGQAQKIQGVSNAIDVLVSTHACALISDGSAYCWGENGSGQLGDSGNSGGYSAIPVKVNTNLQFKSISLGLSLSCGITSDGSTYCWGNNTGNYEIQNSNIPVQVSDTKFSSLSVGDSSYVCGLDLNKSIFCWGKNIKDRSIFNNKPVRFN